MKIWALNISTLLLFAFCGSKDLSTIKAENDSNVTSKNGNLTKSEIFGYSWAQEGDSNIVYVFFEDSAKSIVQGSFKINWINDSSFTAMRDFDLVLHSKPELDTLVFFQSNNYILPISTSKIPYRNGSIEPFFSKKYYRFKKLTSK